MSRGNEHEAEGQRTTWMDVTNESVHTSDDVDIGDIKAINREFIVVKRGYANVHYYYIPVRDVEGWDGHVVWLKITEDRVKALHESDKEPEQGPFYVQDSPYIDARPYPRAYFPEMPIIAEKHRS
ncbi:MAG: hypothetical protein ABI361_07875 [Nitrososphaera sp.]